MKNNNFAQQLARLEEIVKLLEQDDIDLDVGLQLYEEGLNLSDKLQQRLSKFAEKINGLQGEKDDIQ